MMFEVISSLHFPNERFIMRMHLTYLNDEYLSEIGYSNYPYFDVHTHFFPPKLLTTIWSYFEENIWPIHRKDTPENLAKMLISEYNVEQFVVLNNTGNSVRYYPS
jgi:hypothetical protein